MMGAPRALLPDTVYLEEEKVQASRQLIKMHLRPSTGRDDTRASIFT